MKHKDLIFDMGWATWEKVNRDLRYETSSLLRNQMWGMVLAQTSVDVLGKVNDLWDEVDAQVVLTDESKGNR
jgi:hypothetical protein